MKIEWGNNLMCRNCLEFFADGRKLFEEHSFWDILPNGTKAAIHYIKSRLVESRAGLNSIYKY